MPINTHITKFDWLPYGVSRLHAPRWTRLTELIRITS